MADLIISQPMTFTADIKTGLYERPQRESLMKGDAYANRIVVKLMNGDEPFDIEGTTVKGYFYRPPDGDKIELAGKASGNIAEVELDDACYTESGYYRATVALETDGTKRTILYISGDVIGCGSGNAATGGGGLPGTAGGLPEGGAAGQILVKATGLSGDAEWRTIRAGDIGALPEDGTATNSQKLGGADASEYARKTDIPAAKGYLRGNTKTVTPKQVREAMEEGKGVQIIYNEPTWGVIAFSNFADLSGAGRIAATCALQNGNELWIGCLEGITPSDSWIFTTATLATRKEG